MINPDTIIKDNLNDDISKILTEMSQIETWNGTKAVLRDKLVKLLNKRRYIEFQGAPEKYHMHLVGQSILYDVPLYKQGHLKKYRGRRVRIVCIWSGQFKRFYMAGVVGKTPPELIIKTLAQSYTFPPYASECEVIFKTPRFRIIKIRESIIYGDNLSISKKQWPMILIDGRDSLPKGMLKFDTQGHVVCARCDPEYILGTKDNLNEAIKCLMEYARR